MSDLAVARVPIRRFPGDHDLVNRAQHGDEAAFVAIMKQHNRLLFRTARGVVVDDAAAQDVVQEAYLRAFLHLTSYRGDAALGTWLVRITLNAAMDFQRRRGHLVQMDTLPDETSASPTEQMMSYLAADADTPETSAERAQMRDFLQYAIERLPALYRSVFLLRAVEELSVEETASCLEVSTAVVKTRYLRARAMLRATLNEQVDALARQTFTFAGERCDAVVAHVIAELHKQGRVQTR